MSIGTKRHRDEEMKWERSARTSSLRLSVSPSLLPGFSFAEVMFAVIVLGIGFIMIAAVFPVSIQQSKATIYDTSDVVGATAAALVNLQPRPVKVSIANDVAAQNNVDLLALDTTGALAANAQSTDEGAFVIIARDNLAAPNVGRMNGRIYR